MIKPPTFWIRVYRDASRRDLAAELRFPDVDGRLMPPSSDIPSNENRLNPMTVDEAVAILQRREQAWLAFQPQTINAACRKRKALKEIRRWRSRLLRKYYGSGSTD